ncbi:MAG TPA: hypothetical protein VGF40_01485 [Thermoanaerobaculia bacterium]
MAEIHVEKKPRFGLAWLLALLLLLILAAVAWYFWPVESAPATTTSPATVTERSVGAPYPGDGTRTFPPVRAETL